MRSFPKSAIPALGAVLILCSAVTASASAVEKKPAGVTGAPAASTTDPKAAVDPKAKKTAKDGKTPKGTATTGKDGKGAKGAVKPKEPNAPDADGDTDPLSIPLPKGEPQRTVKFPIYATDGTLTYRFDIGVATSVDDDFVKMQQLKILSFKDDEDHPGKRVPDLDMDLPDALLNQKTKDISSNTAVKIKSDNYEVTGNTMKFNLVTRAGTLGGGVKMIIYDMDKMSGGGKPATTVEIDPKKTEIKK